MKENFEKAIKFVLAWETGFGKFIYVNDPKDPGGETKWGISKRHNQDVDIRNLLKEEAIKIYKTRYWDVLDCDNLPPYIDVVAFDIAVNQGVNVAKKCLAKLKTFAKNLVPDAKTGALFLLLERIDVYDDLPLFNVYGRGWVKRAVALAKYVCSDFETLVYDD